MANNNILRSNYEVRAFHALSIVGLLLLMLRVGATEFKVGGSKGWTVPTDPNAPSYNQWAEMHRFQIGDSLLFVYPPDNDSVLQVNKEDYTNCSTAQPISLFNDGHTSFKFNQSGPFYFISGSIENCLKNEKMVVVVMADRNNLSSSSNSTELAPPPNSNETILAPPPPNSNETNLTPPPPPSGSIEIVPSPTPSETPASPSPSPPSGASSVLVSFIGSIGAFVGSYLLLIL
ncbi:PREDICTED: early nodulin-like protein 1 [Nelumbo nucifera]|uniref:Early nodulin-like protein 1 n=2 Tax=Nelumbo nucifera TaxID=4432 RepID=A0A1U8AWR1_NELNU|nr:PREDICTED: early nodulin-like protein 1 [Nelumbo nucifera]DAD23311.1 TPA_asm: hypothetical protein HUJ06_024774 [Nelumbo nucifera]